MGRGKQKMKTGRPTKCAWCGLKTGVRYYVARPCIKGERFHELCRQKARAVGWFTDEGIARRLAARRPT